MKPRIPKGFNKISAGSFKYYMRSSNSNIGHTNDSNVIISVPEYYISKYEVTNLEYKTFINEMVSKITEEQFKILVVDSLKWNNELSYGEPLVWNYFRHPAYNSYPVVNIKHEAALKYCQWLQLKIAKENPHLEVVVNLPTKDQWIYAAKASGAHDVYPFENNSLINSSGDFNCNFNVINNNVITTNKQTGKPEIKETFIRQQSAPYTKAVNSFLPNKFGLYNMSGNVAEMLIDDSIAMGGSWKDFGADVTTISQSFYLSHAATVGFRPVIFIKDK